jgi:endoglucanase
VKVLNFKIIVGLITIVVFTTAYYLGSTESLVIYESNYSEDPENNEEIEDVGKEEAFVLEEGKNLSESNGATALESNSSKNPTPPSSISPNPIPLPAPQPPPPPPSPTPIPSPTPPPTTPPSGKYQLISSNECQTYLSNSPFYLYPQSTIVKKEKEYRDNGSIETANLLREISCFPQAVWLTWQDAAAMRSRVEDVSALAEGLSKIPVFVIYNSPDGGGIHWWVGNQGEEYLYWIEQVGRGVGDRKAWFIVEPDALGLSTDYSEEDRAYRLNELKEVIQILKKEAPNSNVYLDAGHSQWKNPTYFSELLTSAGLGEADGFALNISNYQSLSNEIARGEAISKLTNNKHFIIDTSRNGNGGPDDHEWCNARGRALGVRPTTNTGNGLIDAYFWVKPPGESDGTCNGGPTPGKFWLEYAIELVENSF